jgi:hypothetical protein
MLPRDGEVPNAQLSLPGMKVDAAVRATRKEPAARARVPHEEPPRLTEEDQRALDRAWAQSVPEYQPGGPYPDLWGGDEPRRKNT